MEDLPICTISLGQMQANILYMEHPGIFTHHPDFGFQKGDPKTNRMENPWEVPWDHNGPKQRMVDLGGPCHQISVDMFFMVKWLGPQDSLKKKRTSPKNTKSQDTCAKVKWIRTQLSNIFHKLGPCTSYSK